MKKAAKRMLVTVLTTVLSAAVILADAVAQPVIVPEESTFFATAFVEEGSIYNTPSDGDLWPSAWSDDGNLYLANGDGWGWTNWGWSDIAFSVITDGHPEQRNLKGHRISAGMGPVWSTATCPDGTPKYNRKPTGLTSSGGILYMAVQDLNRCPGTRFFGPSFNDAPNATILKSIDKGATWTWDPSGPMFHDHEFTTIFFLDWGQDGVDNKPGSDWDDYVYAYGLDHNWRDSFSDTVPDPTKLYLARIHKHDDLQDLSNWQFWTGGLDGGMPSWSAYGDISAKKPVLQDDSRVYRHVTANFPEPDIRDMTTISQGSVTYNRALDRFIYLSWTEYTFEFFEAPAPWGPWKKFLSKDFGPYNSPWNTGKNGGYATVMPSKFISEDGLQMWFNANSFEGPVNNYNFSLRKLYVTVHDPSLVPMNAKDDTANLAQIGEAKTPVSGASFHQGNPWALNDGVKNVNTDDWNGVAKTESWWGYTWSRPYNMNKVVYTSGGSFPDGGYFSSDLRVQVRQNFEWVDVTGLSVDPAYPYSAAANPYNTYTFLFDDTWGDGVRIIGKPGGEEHFTTISELEVYYANRYAEIITDGFDGPLSNAWTWEAPKSGPSMAVTGGQLEISVPAHGSYDQWTFIDEAPRLTRTDMGSGNWTVETKLHLEDYATGDNFHAGLAVVFGPNNAYLWGHLQGRALELSRSGFPALAVVNDYDSPTVHLRIRKEGHTYYVDYKRDEHEPWIEAGSDYYPYAAPVAVGLMTKTWSNIAVVTQFDNFTLAK